MKKILNKSQQLLKPIIHLFKNKTNIAFLLVLALLIIGAVVYRRIDNRAETFSVDVEKSAVYYTEGTELLADKKYPEASEKFELAVKYDPKNYNNNFNLGISLYGNKQYDRAILSLTEAVTLAPSNTIKSNTLNVLGNVQRDLGKTDDAIESYKQSIESNQRNYYAYTNSANIYVTQSNLQEAITILRDGFNVSPGQPEITSSLFKALSQVGRKDEAVSLYNSLSEQDRETPLIKASLGI